MSDFVNILQMTQVLVLQYIELSQSLLTEVAAEVELWIVLSLEFFFWRWVVPCSRIREGFDKRSSLCKLVR